ncbi:hypothetical protein N7466_008895 [Penicillium verhagenii]|uniref:uncharacterized protein n=1 Tax=Penicillium verhagenii TaxID=1562060 RepID=UPI0025457B54|nr:uncharacterized protein N7466_008895 [Penicillium verhagenii]KAJ5924708.1 hypothetical protein N7466_008895 [Penicillium verhagenii]
MSTTISIVIFRGDPLDWAMYRHTAIHVQYADSENTILHVTGAHPFFEYTPMDNHPQDLTLHLVASVPVATPPDSITKSMIQNACKRTPIWNDPQHPDWNCQNWVGDALARLVAIGCVTNEERSAAVAQMVDVCLEAEDEPEDM